jgi:hypothetical protein
LQRVVPNHIVRRPLGGGSQAQNRLA